MSIRKEEISVSSASTVQKVVSYIEQRICAQELCPGDRIPTETELCALLGVSRTSVREAIKILESMTIIQVRRGDGTYIARPQDITFYTPWKFKISAYYRAGSVHSLTELGKNALDLPV